jgi:hypothetical protein
MDEMRGENAASLRARQVASLRLSLVFVDRLRWTMFNHRRQLAINQSVTAQSFVMRGQISRLGWPEGPKSNGDLFHDGACIHVEFEVHKIVPACVSA